MSRKLSAKHTVKNDLGISQSGQELALLLERHALLIERHFEMLVELRDSSKQPPPKFMPIDPPPADPAFNKETASQSVPSPHMPLQCFEGCSCRCHRRAVIRSPRSMSGLVGDVFIGYSNLPWSLSGLVACTEQTCRRSQRIKADMAHFSPPWVGQVIGSLTVSVRLRWLPLNIHVRSRQVIPYDSPITMCVQQGDLDGARKLLLSGEASVNDVDPYGLGLLYVSGMKHSH